MNRIRFSAGKCTVAERVQNRNVYFGDHGRKEKRNKYVFTTLTPDRCRTISRLRNSDNWRFRMPNRTYNPFSASERIPCDSTWDTGDCHTGRICPPKCVWPIVVRRPCDCCSPNSWTRTTRPFCSCSPRGFPVRWTPTADCAPQSIRTDSVRRCPIGNSPSS